MEPGRAGPTVNGPSGAQAAAACQAADERNQQQLTVSRTATCRTAMTHLTPMVTQASRANSPRKT